MSEPGNQPASNEPFADVAVHTGVLRATADLLDLLNDFFTDADPATRARLGTYLVDRYGPDRTTDPTTEAALALQNISEAAELLYSLTGDIHLTGGLDFD